MTQPTVVISLDLELSRGNVDRWFGDDVCKMGRRTHDCGAPNLLNHLTGNGLSATWAVVGAMMHPSLPDISGLPEVKYPQFPKPWFSYVPKEGDESTHPEWFGERLVEMIRSAKPKQEIGFHSFSHIPFGSPGMTRERAVAEYRLCVQTARELGIPTTSFVFPRNLVAYLGELRDSGFTCFRDVDELPVRFASDRLTSLCMIWADFVGLSPRMIEPSIKEGIVSIPGSLLIRYASACVDCGTVAGEVSAQSAGQNKQVEWRSDPHQATTLRRGRMLAPQELAIGLRKKKPSIEPADEAVGPVAAAHFPKRPGHDSSWSSSWQWARR